VTGAYPSPLVHAARDIAQVLLQPLPRRWRHTIGVTRRATDLIPTLDGDDPDILIAAAWLHDIGYAAPVADTGFHPLDGARYLDRLGWPARITALVAHHSGAIYLARAHGPKHRPGRLPVRNDRAGRRAHLRRPDHRPGRATHQPGHRIAEAIWRHGAQSAHATAQPLREPHLRDVARRVENRLAHSTASA
jgi:hypothetical protein